MKQTLAIILILLALAHIGGVIPLYFCALEEIKTEMQLELGNTRQLQKVLVTQQEYNDVKIFRMFEEHEFYYRGNMFDFKTFDLESNGNYVFYALQDNKETTLITLLKTVFNHPDDKNNQTPISGLLKNFIKDFVGTYTATFQHLCFTKNSIKSIPYKLMTLDGFTTEISAPPDNLVS